MPFTEYSPSSQPIRIPNHGTLVFRRSGSLRRSARVLAAAAVVSSGMMVAGRLNAANDPLVPAAAPASATPATPATDEVVAPVLATAAAPAGPTSAAELAAPVGLDIPAGEGATPADSNWPVRAEEKVEEAAPTAAPAPTSTIMPPSPRPMERESLLPLAQPLWTELTPDQQRTLAPFAAEWNIWPVAEKRSWVALSNRMPSMDEAKRAKMSQRIAEWARLTPDERQTARDNYRLAKERSADTRATDWERYRSMTQEQRSVLREAGTTSNTAAGHAGAASGLAKEAAQPLPRSQRRPWHGLAPDQRPPDQRPAN